MSKANTKITALFFSSLLLFTAAICFYFLTSFLVLAGILAGTGSLFLLAGVIYGVRTLFQTSLPNDDLSLSLKTDETTPPNERALMQRSAIGDGEITREFFLIAPIFGSSIGAVSPVFTFAARSGGIVFCGVYFPPADV